MGNIGDPPYMIPLKINAQKFHLDGSHFPGLVKNVYHLPFFVHAACDFSWLWQAPQLVTFTLPH